MPKSLTKVQKHIAKKKGKMGALHEGSRDAKRLQRASARDERIARLASARERQNQPLLQRIIWFRTAAQTHHGPFTRDTIDQHILDYLRRHEEELSSLKKERRPGRPQSTREDLLKQKIAVEQKEYETGLWLPDLEMPEIVELLKIWDGEWVSLNKLKFARYLKSGTRKNSTFPPKGQS